MSFSGWSLVFDLDGTLVDTAPDLAGAMNAVLAEQGRRTLPVSDVRHMVGRGARILIETGFAATGAPVTPYESEQHMRRFLEHYGQNLTTGSRLFEGVAETLTALKAEGANLAVCTNKPHALTIRLLEGLDLLAHFPVILGADALPFRKPDPRHFTECVARLGGAPNRAILIGDSETDLQTARNAGAPIVLVDYGYTQTPAKDLGGDALISRFADLPGVLRTLVSGG